MNANDISIVVAWICVSAVLARLASVWQQLPAKPAIHFNARGQADGWSSRKDFGFSAALLMIGPALGSTVARLVAPGWPQVWILAVVAVIVAAIIWWAIEFNLGKQPFAMRWVLLPIILALAFVFASHLGR